ncbi:MAG TPA: AMP-binding protein [Steroidobacteraceae bacterium]|nr:AMP-binding protein [Steroidobacteraceae bacterium]
MHVASASESDPSAWIESAAAEHPARTFLRTPEGPPVSYAQLRERTARYAAALLELGVRPGERVAVQVEKSCDAVLLYLACLRVGAAFVPINVANTLPEVEYFLQDSQPRLAVVRPQARAELAPLAQRVGVECFETLGTAGDGTLTERARRAAPAADLPRALPADALAALVYTSGTTGRSKGAMLTRGNLASNAAALARAWRFTGTDTLLHTLPLFHVHGLFAAINTVLASGAALLLLPKFEAAAVLRHLRDATVLMGVPTHYTRLLKETGLDRRSCEHVRLFVSGSAPLLPETHREFFARTAHTILERYGMTETLMNTSNPYDGERVAGSVGPPLPGVRIRVTHPDGGAPPAAADAIGTLEIKGPNVFTGYWHDADKTRQAFTADGWFRTGDLGLIDANGYVHIVGRQNDLVISGGYNVYPKEVESQLDALPGVAESAVFGVPHPDFGEGVTAAVVPQPGALLTESDILRAIGLRVARYKIPKRVLLVTELPRNAMGKVQKNALRQAYAGLYRE